MSDLSTGIFAFFIFMQVAIFLALVFLAFRLVKVIKSQNNGKLLSPETLKRLRGKGPGPGR